VTPLEGARRLVVKIGSSILVDETKGEIRRDWLETLTDDVARLHKGGCEVVVVSSGAIATTSNSGPVVLVMLGSLADPVTFNEPKALPSPAMAVT
jgi:uridylate kinase